MNQTVTKPASDLPNPVQNAVGAATDPANLKKGADAANELAQKAADLAKGMKDTAKKDEPSAPNPVSNALKAATDPKNIKAGEDAAKAGAGAVAAGAKKVAELAQDAKAAVIGDGKAAAPAAGSTVPPKESLKPGESVEPEEGIMDKIKKWDIGKILGGVVGGAFAWLFGGIFGEGTIGTVLMVALAVPLAIIGANQFGDFFNDMLHRPKSGTPLAAGQTPQQVAGLARPLEFEAPSQRFSEEQLAAMLNSASKNGNRTDALQVYKQTNNGLAFGEIPKGQSPQGTVTTAVLASALQSCSTMSQSCDIKLTPAQGGYSITSVPSVLGATGQSRG